MAFVQGTATDYQDALAQLEQIMSSNGVTAVAIAAGGTGYVVDDILTVSGGTFTHAATLRVTSVAAGVIDGVQVEQSGAYTVNPTNPVSHTGGTGTGATFNLTLAAYGWTTLRNTTFSGGDEMIFRGNGSGSDEIFWGVQTFNDLSANGFNWDIAGFTGYLASEDFTGQPGETPGGHQTSTFNDPLRRGMYLLLDDASLDFWYFIDSFRVVGVIRAGTSYESFYAGFLGSFLNTSQSPYPMFVGASSPVPNARFTTTRVSHSGFADPRSKEHLNSVGPTVLGPAYVRIPGGSWAVVANAYEEDTDEAALVEQNFRVVWPTGNCLTTFGTASSDANGAGYNGTYTTRLIKSAVSEVPTLQLHPTPGTPNDQIPLIPLMAYANDAFYGELSGCFWTTGYGSAIAAEDEIVQGNDRYLVFQNGPRTAETALFAVKK